MPGEADRCNLCIHKSGLNEVDSGRDRAKPASVRLDDDDEEKGLQKSERGGQEHEQGKIAF